MAKRKRTNQPPLGYQMRNRDPERAMGRGAQQALQRYVKNAARRKSNGGQGG